MIQWVQLPLWLMQLHLTPTACIIYAMIANRYKLSIQTHAASGHWSDDNGVYCIYPRAELAAAAGLSINSITRAMRELVDAGIIIDRRIGQGRPNRIYIVDMPDDLPTIDHADQLALADAAAEQTSNQATAEQTDQLALADAAAEQTSNQATAEQTDQLALADAAAEQTSNQATARIPTPTNQESQHLGNPYIKKNNTKKYSDGLGNPTIEDKIRHCLKIAYNIDPDSISPSIINIARQRCTRARNVKNPITYAAAIVANILTENDTETLTLDPDAWENDFDRRCAAFWAAVDATTPA